MNRLEQNETNERFLLRYHAVSEHKFIVKDTSYRAIDILILNKSLFAGLFLKYGKSKVFFCPISINLIVFNTGECKLRIIFSKTPLSMKKFASFSSNFPGRDNIW